MSGGAHRLMGIVLGGMVISVVKPVLPAAVVVVITSVWGEMTPDIDTVNSTISRRIPIIPRLINRKFGPSWFASFSNIFSGVMAGDRREKFLGQCILYWISGTLSSRFIYPCGASITIPV